MEKETKNKGITLIVLVITIIVLLILVGISIASLTGENGLLKKAMKAKEETEIKGYHERIELVRTELRLQKENYASPTIAEMQKEFDENQTEWVASTEIKLVEGIETLELKTKEGYIFHITETETEYKGKGEVVDTSALKREDALKLEMVGEGNNGGKLVQITDLSGVDYYEIEYTIGDREGNWLPIESRNTVEVGPSLTIYARLVYETNKGVIVSLSIEATEPTVIAKDTDMSQVVRKTQIPLVDLFEITWGSDGIGTVEYSIAGSLNFQNTSFSSTEISNVSELEIGNYEVTCKVTSPSNKVQTATKQNVKITRLANTTVANASNSQVAANAIYSEYDLAYFRDLVNGGQFALNAKLMNDINLVKVCSVDKGSWIPIGVYNLTEVLDSSEIIKYYDGIFDGEGHTIENLYIDNVSLRRQGLFSVAKEKSIIKNIEVLGSIKALNGGGICGQTLGNIWNCKNKANLTMQGASAGIVSVNRGNISNCDNTGNIIGGEFTGGIVGLNEGNIENCMSNATIQGKYKVGGITGKNSLKVTDCCNLGEVIATEATIQNGTTDIVFALVGGITGVNAEAGTVTRSINQGRITANYRFVGGIVGSNRGLVSYCCNKGNVSSPKRGVGGIVGYNVKYVTHVYNIATKIEAGQEGNGNSNVGGIVGGQGDLDEASVRYSYNKATIKGKRNVGGIIGMVDKGTVSNTYNMGTLDTTETVGIGNIVGQIYDTSAKTNSKKVTETEMIGWSQNTITTNLKNFVKKNNSLPILDITVRGICF